MPKADRCKVNGPNVQNPNEMVRILKTEHVWEWDTFGKRRNPKVRISALYCTVDVQKTERFVWQTEHICVPFEIVHFDLFNSVARPDRFGFWGQFFKYKTV